MKKTAAPKDEITVSRWSVISVAALAVLLLGGLLAGMIALGVFKLPFSTGGGEGENQLDSDPIWSALTSGRPVEGTAVSGDADYSDFRAELARAPYFDVYSASVRIAVSGGGSRSVNTVKIWADGEKYRVELYYGAKLLKSTVCDGESVRVTDYATYEQPVSKKYPASEQFTLEAAAGIPSISQFLDGETLSDAENVENLEITRISTAEVNAFSISYNTTLPPQSEELTISLEYGLVVYAKTLDASGSSTYTATLTSVSPSLTGYSGDADSIFSTRSTL